MKKIAGIVALVACGLACLESAAEEPKAEAKPTVKMVNPLGLAADSTSKLVARGLLLDTVTEVRVENSPLQLKILSKGKVALPPNTDPKRLGDTQLELEATAPAGLTGEVRFTVVGPGGESERQVLVVVPKDKAVAKREPNGGFQDAQPLESGQVVLGAIDGERNVDVFRLQLKTGQKLVAELAAARYGSLLDGLLTLYDSRGRFLASDDDTVGFDPRLEFAVTADGVYYLVLVDALDHGGTTHPYQLTVTAQ